MVIETETRELIETFTTALRQAYQLLDELEEQRYLRERDASAVYDCSHIHRRPRPSGTQHINITTTIIVIIVML